MSGPYSIAFVERSTGIGRETLRIWERRYGFPSPRRDAAGDRSYSRAELDRLRVIKRLLDQGYRPGKVVPMADAELAALAPLDPAKGGGGALSDAHAEFLDLLNRAEAAETLDWLRRRLAAEGLAGFVLNTLTPLVDAVGDAWAAGRVRIHEEHLFSEQVQRVLRQAIATLPAGAGPRILLTTLPEEQHGLGLLMAEALFSLQGARCFNLGVNTPTPEVVAAALRHRIDVLALSFSPAYPRRRIAPQILALRAELPAACEIWAGGRITARLRVIEGVRFCPKLVDAGKLLARWHDGKGSAD